MLRLTPFCRWGKPRPEGSHLPVGTRPGRGTAWQPSFRAQALNRVTAPTLEQEGPAWNCCVTPGPIPAPCRPHFPHLRKKRKEVEGGGLLAGVTAERWLGSHANRMG